MTVNETEHVGAAVIQTTLKNNDNDYCFRFGTVVSNIVLIEYKNLRFRPSTNYVGSAFIDC